MRTRSRVSATNAKLDSPDKEELPVAPSFSKKRKQPSQSTTATADSIVGGEELKAAATPTGKPKRARESEASTSLAVADSQGETAPDAARAEKPRQDGNTANRDAVTKSNGPDHIVVVDSASTNPPKESAWNLVEDVSSATSTESEAAVAPPANASKVNAHTPVVEAPKGRSVSGRDWKVRKQSQRASMQVTTATETLSTTWAKKLELKAKRKAIMSMEKEMKDRKRQEIEEKKQEKLEREKRRQQNEMKNTTYQTISKTHKLKTMSKKQLRQIKKRQVNSRTGEIEFVSPWGGGKKK